MTSQSINAFLEDIGEVMKGFFLGCIVVAGGCLGWATAQARQPALTLRAEPVPVSSLARFDQAQGGGR